MIRKNSEQLGDVIKRMLKAYRQDDKYFQAAFTVEWERLMGPMITRHTDNIYYKGGKLVIYLNSSVLRQELSFTKEKIIRSLNEAIGEPLITEVQLR